MENLTVDMSDLSAFEQHLRSQEKSRNTVSKYLADVRQLFAYMGPSGTLDRDRLSGYKAWLKSGGLTPGSVNTKICSVNAFLNFKLRPDLKMKLVRIQHEPFRDTAKDLTEKDFRRLLETAERTGKTRTAMLLKTLVQTGVRVSELEYLTVESVQSQKIRIDMKSKCRTVFVPKTLMKGLMAYAKAMKIKTGPIFVTRTGRPVSRKQIWAELKALAGRSGVVQSKVFPHNLRHLFARLYYGSSGHDIAKLSDILGHSSMDTTRIYLATTGLEHLRSLDKLTRTLCL